MANPASPDTPGRQPIPPAKRRRLQQQFEHGSKMAASGQFDYATELFAACVLGDPGNLIYVQNFLGNLQKKYNNNKKGSKLAAIKGASKKGAIKKSQMQKDWLGVIRDGLEMLKLNPWDASTLTAMADACEKLEFDECQLAYLRGALDGNMKDPELNRRAGRALARQGLFDDAIVCWHRVEKAIPGDQEAQRAIGDLTVERTIQKGGYEGAESGRDVRKDDGDHEDEPAAGLRLTPEKQLEKAIAKDPGETTNYIRLADLHTSHERFEEAEKVLARALEASGGDVNIRERLEDAQLRRQREAVGIAEKRLRSERTPEAENLYKRLRAELNQKELEVYVSRAERYPTNLTYKYEIGVRLKRGGKPREAIPYLQQALADPRRKGEVLLLLGECFQQIKPPQIKLAMSNYTAAVEEIPDAEVELKKRALYRTGVLSFGCAAQSKSAGDAPAASKHLDAAENYLTTLAGMDFAYKDVSALLDKIAQMRNDL